MNETLRMALAVVLTAVLFYVVNRTEKAFWLTQFLIVTGIVVLTSIGIWTLIGVLLAL
jgi:hypothetical protein